MNKQRVNKIEEKLNSLNNQNNSYYNLDLSNLSNIELERIIDNSNSLFFCFYLASKELYFLPEKYLLQLKIDPTTLDKAPEDYLFPDVYYLTDKNLIQKQKEIVVINITPKKTIWSY
jgi:hypothetical protein